MPCYPIFCTAKMPTELLENLIVLRRNITGGFGSDEDLYFVTPIHPGAEFRDIDTIHKFPKQDLTNIQPFADWSIQECYSFYKTWLQNGSEDSSNNFTAFTFVILDSDTLSGGSTHGTAIVCTDAPDISDIPKQRGEGEKIPILKFRRIPFEGAVLILDALEMMTRMFSDIGQDEQLDFHADSWFRPGGYTKEGNRVRYFVSPKDARAKQERLVQEYVNGKAEVDITSDDV